MQKGRKAGGEEEDIRFELGCRKTELWGTHVTWSGHRCREVTRKKLQEQKSMTCTKRDKMRRSESYTELQDI